MDSQLSLRDLSISQLSLNYLLERSQCVVVNGATSERVPVLSGVATTRFSFGSTTFTDIH